MFHQGNAKATISILEELGKLAKLKKQGVITEEEFSIFSKLSALVYITRLLLVVLLAVLLTTLLAAGVMCTNSYILS